MRNHRITLLAIGHACIDFCQGAVPALFPFLMAWRGYGYAAASGMILASGLLASVVQPVFGALTDRRPMPWLLPGSMAVAGLGLGFSGIGGSYAVTWIAIAVCGLGVAAYHPEATRLGRIASGGSHMGMSWFSLGGLAGFAVAPLLITPVLAAAGPAAIPLLAVPPLLGALLTVTVLRGVTRRPAAGRAGPRPSTKDDWPAFLRLTAAVAARSIVCIGLSAFIALYAAERTGGGATSGSIALFALFAGNAAGTLLGGRLAMRFGRLRTIRVAGALAVPVVAGLVHAPGPAVHVLTGIAGIVLFVPFSLLVTLGQDYLPNRVGTAGGVTLGLAGSVGGLAGPVLGAAADASSLRVALTGLIAFAAVAWLVSRTFAEPSTQEEPCTATPSAASGAISTSS